MDLNQGSQDFNYNNYDVNQGMDMQGVNNPQGMFNQPVNSQGMFNQPVDSQGMFNQPVNPQGMFNQPENSQGMFNQPENSQGMFNQPENPQGMFNQPLDSQGMFNQPVDPQGMFNQPVNPQGMFNQPVNTQGMFNQPENPQGMFNQPVNPQGMFNQPVNPQGMFNQPVNPQGMFNQPVNPQGMFNQPENQQEQGGFYDVTRTPLEQAGLATSTLFTPLSIQPPPYTDQQGDVMNSTGDQSNMNMRNTWEESDTYSYSSSTGESKTLTAQIPKYEGNNYYLPSCDINQNNNSQSNLNSTNQELNQNNSLTYPEMNNYGFGDTGTPNASTQLSNSCNTDYNAQINQPPPSYYNHTNSMHTYQCDQSTQNQQNPPQLNQTFQPQYNHRHQQLANQVATPYFNQGLQKQVNQTHLQHQNQANHQQVNQAQLPQLSQYTAPITQTYRQYNQPPQPANQSTYFPNTTVQYSSNIQNQLLIAQPPSTTYQPLNFLRPLSSQMKSYLNQQRNNNKFNYNTQTLLTLAPPVRLNQPIQQPALNRNYNNNITNQKLSPQSSPTRGRRSRVRNLTNSKRSEPLKRNERERTPFPSRKTERESTPFPLPYRSTPSVLPPSSPKRSSGAALSASQARKFVREGTPFPTQKAERKNTSLSSLLAQRPDRIETPLPSLLPLRPDRIETPLLSLPPLRTNRKESPLPSLPPPRTDRKESPHPPQRAEAIISLVELPESPPLPSLPPLRTNRKESPLPSLPPPRTDRKESPHPPQRAEATISLVELPESPPLPSLPPPRTDRKESPHPPQRAEATISLVELPESPLPSLPPPRTDRKESPHPPQRAEATISLVELPGNALGKEGSRVELQESSERTTTSPPLSGTNRDSKPEEWQKEQSTDNQNHSSSSQQPTKSPQSSAPGFSGDRMFAQKSLKQIIGGCMDKCNEPRCRKLMSMLEHLVVCRIWHESACQDCRSIIFTAEHGISCVDLSCKKMECCNPHVQDSFIDDVLKTTKEYFDPKYSLGTDKNNKPLEDIEIMWEDAMYIITTNEEKQD